MYYALYENNLIELIENHLIIYPNTNREVTQDDKYTSVISKDYLPLIQKIIKVHCVDNMPVLSVSTKEKNRVMKNEVVNRTYFHSVTGRVMNEDSDEEDYFIDNEEIWSNMAERIEEHNDINETEKKFMNLWNKFMLRNGKIIYIKPRESEELLNDFYKNNEIFIKENKLKECFILHVINLYDYMKITSEQMVNILKIIN
jgi:hypothetical protein